MLKLCTFDHGHCRSQSIRSLSTLVHPRIFKCTFPITTLRLKHKWSPSHIFLKKKDLSSITMARSIHHVSNHMPIVSHTWSPHHRLQVCLPQTPLTFVGLTFLLFIVHATTISKHPSFEIIPTFPFGPSHVHTRAQGTPNIMSIFCPALNFLLFYLILFGRESRYYFTNTHMTKTITKQRIATFPTSQKKKIYISQNFNEPLHGFVLHRINARQRTEAKSLGPVSLTRQSAVMTNKHHELIRQLLPWQKMSSFG